MRRREVIVAGCCALVAMGAASRTLIEPHMTFVPAGDGPEVAITLDACMGETDMRILSPLIEQHIAVTLFVTQRWLEHNPAAITLLAQHSDLFKIENHGAQHLPAVIGDERPYGIAPAGTAAAVRNEVIGGANAIVERFGTRPTWYRDATALYSRDAMALIAELGFLIGGFSLNGDIGASASAASTQQRIAAARSGDVIISHINQPKRAAGAGVIAGILALKKQGFAFRHLDDVVVTDIA